MDTSGIRGFKNKGLNRERNGEDFYRSARSTLGKRIHKKLTKKPSWYRKRKSSEIVEQTFVGLNANGLPDKPLRKRKRSEDDLDILQGGSRLDTTPAVLVPDHQIII